MLGSDTLSIWQFGPGPEQAILLLNISAHPACDISASIVRFQEQALGCHHYLLTGKSTADLVKGYLHWHRVLDSYRQFGALAFDVSTGQVFDQLKAARIRIGTMDLRIAAIALAGNLTLVTRNRADFSRVPNLWIEDWTQ